MPVSRQFKFRVAALVVTITAFLTSTELPRISPFELLRPERPLSGSERARTLPLSDKMITLKFTVDDDSPVEVSQFEGGLIRIEKSGKAIYGFSAIINAPAKGTILIAVYQIGKIRSLGRVVKESLKDVHTLVVDQVDGKYLTTYEGADARFKIEVLDVQIEVQRGGEGPTAEYYLEECCLSCGDQETCACRVKTACGGCCDGSCCRKVN